MMLRLSMHTRLARHPRTKCQACKRRRLVYSILAESPGGAGRAESPRLCAECAGIIGGQEPQTIDDVLAIAELLPGQRLVRVDEAFVDDLVRESPFPVTWEWGEPDAQGVYQPVFTRHE